MINYISNTAEDYRSFPFVLDKCMPICSICEEKIADTIYLSKTKGLLLCEECAYMFDEYQDEIKQTFHNSKIICADCGKLIDKNGPFVTNKIFPRCYKDKTGYKYPIFHKACIFKENKQGWEIAKG